MFKKLFEDIFNMIIVNHLWKIGYDGYKIRGNYCMKASREILTQRLIGILTKLNHGDRVTFKDLSNEYGVSLRTIQRDFENGLSYLPIKKEKNFYFLEPYALGTLSFDDIKNFAAISGVKHLFPALSDDFIIDILNTRIHSAYLIKPNAYEDITSKSEQFKLLSVAILENVSIRCSYKNKSRFLNPYKLVNHHGIWYLVADDEGVLKNFSFSKIFDLNILKKKYFKPKKDFIETLNKPDSNWFSQTMFDVILEISPSVGSYFLERKILPNQTVLKHTSSALILKTKVSYDEEILRIVQYWLPYIKIIEPTHLQEKLNDLLTGYLKTT